MKILIVEDEPSLNLLLAQALRSENYIIDSARDGEEGSFLARTNSYDLIIMDYMLPKINGLEVIKEIRAEKISTPIIMLTVRSEIDDKVIVLGSGADDYLTKPFSMAELSARIKVLTKRPKINNKETFSCGQIVLDPESFSATNRNKPVSLTGKEYALLEFFVKHQGKVLSRTKLLEGVWDINGDPFSNTIEMHILKLRKKLNDKKQKIISTLPGRGYRLEIPKCRFLNSASQQKK
jgi:DNA-binding response OmpR family regulator